MNKVDIKNKTMQSRVYTFLKFKGMPIEYYWFLKLYLIVLLIDQL